MPLDSLLTPLAIDWRASSAPLLHKLLLADEEEGQDVSANVDTHMDT